MDYGAKYADAPSSQYQVKRNTVVQFVDQIAQAGEPGKPTIVVLDNAKIHHGINEKTLHRWSVEHSLFLLYLPAYSPELNLIEIILKQAKYHWRRLVTWTKETIDDEIAALLGGYGSKFEINFS